jgi:hypothetical protein
MTFVPGGVPGVPRNPEIMRQYSKAKQADLLSEAIARGQAREARRGWVRRILRRGKR